MSHCPDFDSQWTHDEGNLQFYYSGRIVNTSGHSGMHPKPSCVHRLRFLGFGSSFGSVHKIFDISKSCRMSSRSCTFEWTSCVLLVHRVAIVRPSCVHRVGRRVAIAFTLCGHWRNRAFSPHDGNTIDILSLPMVSGRLHDVARPSHSHRVSMGSRFNITSISQ